MESIPANKSCNKHDPPTAKIPEVINNKPNVFNSHHEANNSLVDTYFIPTFWNM